MGLEVEPTTIINNIAIIDWREDCAKSPNMGVTLSIFQNDADEFLNNGIMFDAKADYKYMVDRAPKGCTKIIIGTV